MLVADSGRLRKAWYIKEGSCFFGWIIHRYSPQPMSTLPLSHSGLGSLGVEEGLAKEILRESLNFSRAWGALTDMEDKWGYMPVLAGEEWS